MTDSIDESKFFVPRFVTKTFQGLLLPGQKLEEVFDQIGGLMLEGSNEIKPYKTVWGSKTMIFKNKKPKTLDMFFKKVIKTETDDIDSNCSVNSNDGSVIEESSQMKRCKSSPDSVPQTSSPEKDSKNILIGGKNITFTPTIKLKSKINEIKNKHTVSSSEDESLEEHARNSPTYSVDLFAEEIQKSPDHSNEINGENSLSDEETIGSSQVHPSSSSLDALSTNKSSIKSLQKPSAGIKYSESTKDPDSRHNLSKQSNKQNSLQNEISSSSSEEEEDAYNGQPALSMLDSIRNSMKNIKNVFPKIEGNTETFSFGDLTEDDELYILQCPNEVDCKKLEGVELTLEGSSVVSVDEESSYDCFSIKQNSKRYLYVALPDSNEQGMKLGVVPLAGNIILSENLGIPYTKPIKDDTQDNVTLENCNTSLNEKSPGQRVAKKKKKHKNTDDTLNETTATECFSKDVTEVLNQLVSKKRKRNNTNSLESSDIDSRLSEVENVSNLKTECEGTQIIPETQDQETPLKTKKKKKRSKEGKEINSSFSDFSDVQSLKTDWEHTQIIPDTQDQETPLKVKKKKRRSRGDITQDEATESEYFSDNVTDVLNKLASNKKKRKHSNLGSNEVTDCESEFDKFLNIKTEWGEPQVVSDFQETPSKSKKRSRKDMEDSEELSIEEVTNKKKKKKHSYSGSQDIL